MRAATLLPLYLSFPVSAQPRKAWLSFFCFFFLLTSYFVLRPVRDQIGVTQGVRQLPWLFTGTFLATLAIVPFYAFLFNNLKRYQTGLAVYLLSVVLLVVAFFLVETFPFRASVGLFIGISVYNVFIVSVFWSVLADLFARPDALFSYGFIAAGGTLGALAGPAISMAAVSVIGVNQLILLSAWLLAMASLFMWLLVRNKEEGVIPRHVKPIWSGVRSSMKPGLRSIMLFIFFYSAVSTFVYFSQSRVVGQQVSTPELRTQYYAGVDLCINGVALVLQLVLTSRVLQNFQTSRTLSIVPLIVAGLLLLLGLTSGLGIITAVAVLHRVGHFSFLTPTRESLFTLVSYDDKYKSKNFIDTVIFRGSDAISGWGMGLLFQQQWPWVWLGVAGFTLALGWSLAGYFLGRRFEYRNKNWIR